MMILKIWLIHCVSVSLPLMMTALSSEIVGDTSVPNKEFRKSL